MKERWNVTEAAKIHIWSTCLQLAPCILITHLNAINSSFPRVTYLKANYLHQRGNLIELNY
jgi:hypothetical protein